jgi:hypothetical protein
MNVGKRDTSSRIVRTSQWEVGQYPEETRMEEEDHQQEEETLAGTTTTIISEKAVREAELHHFGASGQLRPSRER